MNYALLNAIVVNRINNYVCHLLVCYTVIEVKGRSIISAYFAKKSIIYKN